MKYFIRFILPVMNHSKYLRILGRIIAIRFFSFVSVCCLDTIYHYRVIIEVFIIRIITSFFHNETANIEVLYISKHNVLLGWNFARVFEKAPFDLSLSI